MKRDKITLRQHFFQTIDFLNSVTCQSGSIHIRIISQHCHAKTFRGIADHNTDCAKADNAEGFPHNLRPDIGAFSFFDQLADRIDGLKREWREASKNLGATTWQYWRYVTLPILLPSLLGATILLFGNAFGAYSTAYSLIGDRYHNSDFIRVALDKLFDGLKLPVDYTINYSGLSAKLLSNYRLFVCFRDGMIWPKGYRGPDSYPKARTRADYPANGIDRPFLRNELSRGAAAESGGLQPRGNGAILYFSIPELERNDEGVLQAYRSVVG